MHKSLDLPAASSQLQRTGHGATWLLLLATLLIGMVSSATAGVTITNIVGKSESRKSATTGLDETWVVVTYNITNVPTDGAVLYLDATLTDTKGNQVEVTPTDVELQGDFGDILADGAKKIEWNAEATLVRTSKQGKYQCQVTLTIAGNKDATEATLNIQKYVDANWYYFNTGSAIITDLQKTTTFSPTCQPVLGGDWQNQVEAGAVFYKGKVTNFPKYRGRRAGDQISGTYDRSGCSAFLAIKDQGTPKEKMWVNFATHYNGQIVSNGNIIPVDWEFQARYFSSRKDGSTALKLGNAGNTPANGFALNNEGAFFDLVLSAAPAAKEQSNSFEVEVVRRVFKYSYKGTQLMTFRALDNGYFEGAEPNKLILKNGDMQINSWVRFHGQITIDTTTDNASFDAYGTWYTRTGQTLTSMPLMGSIDTALEFSGGATGTPLAPEWAINGIAISMENLHFVGGVDNATGIAMNIRLLFNQLTTGCKFDAVPIAQGVGGVLLKGVEMSDEGWEIHGIEAQNISIPVVPDLCMQSFVANYDKATKKFTVDVIVRSSFFKEIGGGFGLLDGQFDAFHIRMKLETGIPIPIPEPPVMQWKGFDVLASKIAKGPFTLDGTVFLSNSDAWKSVPAYKWLKDKVGDAVKVTLFEVDGTGHLAWPNELGVGGNIRVFGLFDAQKLWAIQGKVNVLGRVSYANTSLTATGELDFVNLGGSQYLAVGTGSLGVTVFPQFNVSSSLKADLYVPDLFKNNPVFSALNKALGLPYKLYSEQMLQNNLSLAFNWDTKGLGMGVLGVLVDLSQNPVTDPLKFIHIQNTPVKLGTAYRKWDKDHTASVDTTFHTMTTTAGTQSLLVQIWGDPAAPASVLINPAGTLYAATASDSSVIYYPPTASDPSALWIVKNPVAGTWKLGTIGEKAGDSVSVWGIPAKRSDFQFTSQEQGRTIQAQWSGTGAPAGSMVSFYLDTDNKGYDGIFIGQADESTGAFSYTMTDSLPDCGYYIYAMRNDSLSISSIYSPTYLANPKSWLMAPTGIQAVATPAGEATITWNRSADPNALMYSIRVTDKNGVDSIYTSTGFNYTMAQVHIEDWQNKTVSMQTIGDNNLSGCWSDPVAIAMLGVDRQAVTGATPQQLETFVAPNPSGDRATLFVNLTRQARIQVELYDATGRHISTVAQGTFEAGTLRHEMDVTGLANGSYVIRITGDGLEGTQMLVVQR